MDIGHIHDTPPTTNCSITTCLPLPSALPWDQPPSSWSTPPKTWLQTVSGDFLKNGQYHRKLSTNRFVFGGSGHFLPIAIVHKLNSRLTKYLYTLRMRVTPDRENRFCGTIKPVKNSENGSIADLWRKAMHFNPIWKVHSINLLYLKYYDILVGNCLVRLCQWNNV